MSEINGFSNIQKTTAALIHDNGKVISKGKMANRLVYQSDSGHSFLNLAISQKLNKRSISLNIKIGTKVETVAVNRNSLIKRLEIRKEDLEAHKDDMEGFINDCITAKELKIAAEFKKRATDPWKPSIGQQPLHSLSQKIRAKISDIIWFIGTERPYLPKLLSSFKMSSCNMQKFSEARAVAAYHQASKQVPAYQEFLKKHPNATSYDQVPVMDKENYILKNPIEATLLGGKFPKGGQVDTSTGTTKKNKPTVWVRSREERNLNRKIINQLRKNIIGDAFFINAYALGSLSTGMTVHSALVDRNLISSTGPDCDKVLEMVELMGSKNQKIVIAGYPSFMSRLIDRAVEKGIDLKKYDVTAIVGGEGISEILRDRLTGNLPGSPGGFKKVISSYGASDLDINISFETDFAVALRKECLKNPTLAKELFGDKNGSPMIFQYNPFFYFIESDKDGHLVYTSISGVKNSPRVRYDSHDIGMVMTSAELKTKLQQFNLPFDPPEVNLPFLFIWGREGSAATYYSANVTPDELERAIQTIPGLQAKVENYALNTYEDSEGRKKLDFWLEVKNGAHIDDIEAVNAGILNYLRETSVDFRRMHDVAVSNNDFQPQTIVYPYGNSPMSNQPSHRKQQFIFAT